MTDRRFEGRVVLITGAGTGIGRSLTLAYAREGARLVIGARRAEPLEETARGVRALGGECLVIPADVTREADCIALVRTTLDHCGRLDVLVNNAGAPGTDMPVAEMTLANWNETIAVNLTGPMLLTREALSRAMLPARRGNVQFLSSAAAKNVRPRKAHYAAAKLGLVALTQTLAHEVGDHGVRVNCIVVGLVAGELVDRWVARMAAESGRSEDGIRAALVAGFPVKRALEADEIASVSLFLASDAASGITGQSINVTNGALAH
jgi:NAD(P)-dependent dehydrogenase (short-subunit alcohol dehydrogenase family)